MPRKPTKRLLLQYQPTAGLNADFEELLQRFTGTETVRFEKFSEIWREMKMNMIYAGRQTEKECREFTEEMFKMALKYVLPPYNFQVRVGGLYLLYGLFNQQPLMRKVRVRVSPQQWRDIVEFQNEARRQQHLDVNYVFHKLRFDDCFIFAAKETEVSFYLSSGGNSADEDTGPEEFKDEQSVLYELFSDQFLEQLTQLHSHYHKVKVGLEGPEATEPSRSLNVIQPNLTTSILGTVVAFQQRKQQPQVVVKKSLSDTEQNDTDLDDIDINKIDSKNRKSHLKAKAFRNVAKAHKSRRHRQAADGSPGKSPKGRKHKSSSETDSSPTKKRKIGKKKKIKIEEESLDEHENEADVKGDAVAEEKTEEVINSIECVREATPGEILHMPSFDEEPSTSGIEKLSATKKQNKTVESPDKNDDKKQKTPEKKTKQEKKSKKGSKETKEESKKIKGKMPSIKLQPLQRNKNSPKKSRGRPKKKNNEENT